MPRPARFATARRAAAATLVALALGLPTAAYPFSLAHLLQLPLDQLLQLEIDVLRSAAAPLGGARDGR